jgi:riboflavin synthase
MFTGIVETLAVVCDAVPEGAGRRVAVEVNWPSGGAAVGDSIAVNGVCLTAIACASGRVEFQAGPETLDRTNLGSLRVGDRVNLERALLPTTRVGGHFVQGHVDGVARVVARRREQDWEFVEFAADRSLTDQMLPKGSVAVDGVSLTLVGVSPSSFSVMLIPRTLAHTTLGVRAVGDTVNVETDILGKYVLHAVRNLDSGVRGLVTALDF